MTLRIEQRDELIGQLFDYLNQEILDGAGEDRPNGLTAESPLLEWGVLNSISIVRLLGHIREEFGITVPPTQLTAKNFRNLNAIADMLLSVWPA